MPCWEVNTYQVEFQMEHKERLLEAIKALGLSSYQENRGRNVIIGYGREGIAFQLEKGQVKCAESKFSVVNQIKQKYSELTLVEMARKKKMILKKVGENKFQMRKI